MSTYTGEWAAIRTADRAMAAALVVSLRRAGFAFDATTVGHKPRRSPEPAFM
jgi:hypothetical protein